MTMYILYQIVILSVLCVKESLVNGAREMYIGDPGECKEPNGMFPNPNDCSTFFHCANGINWVKPCGEGTLFNPDLLVCDWPDNVHCINNDCPDPNGIYPNPDDCETFFQCYHGQPTKMKCGLGLHFNPDIEGCDWPENAGCDFFYFYRALATRKPSPKKED